jgi:hypothetical protein
MNQDLYNHGIITPSLSAPPTPWVRNPEWLAMPTVLPTENKIVMLVRINNDTANYLAFTIGCLGGYSVDWGDGTSVNTATGVASYKRYDYASVPGSPTTDGYKQVLVTITPTAPPNNFSSVALNTKHNLVTGNGNYDGGILDLIISAPLCGGTLAIAGVNYGTVYFRYLERALILSSAVTSYQGVFANLLVLRSCSITSSATVTSMSSMFSNCRLITDIPTNLPFSTVTDINSMFSSCRALQYCPPIELNQPSVIASSIFNKCYNLKNAPFTPSSWDKLSTLASAFSNCISLQQVPSFTATNITSLSSAFSSCSALVSVGDITSSSKLTDVTSCFNGCNALQKLPLISDTSAVTTFATFAQGCFNITYIPSYNTSNVTSFSSAFSQCYKVKSFPTLNYTKCTNASAMFQECTFEKTGPIDFGTTTTGTINLSSMFRNSFTSDSGVVEIGPISIPSTATSITVNLLANNNVMVKSVNIDCTKVIAATGIANIFTATGCSLASVILTGLRFGGFSIIGAMDAPALVALFTSLGTASGAQTLTVSANWGWASLTAGEKAIATGKGWTLA